MKKLTTKLMAISKLAYDPNNAREHGDSNLEYIKGSLAKFGQQKPIVVTPEGLVIAGNGTLEAAKDLGWEKINVIETKLDSLHQTAYALADNRTSETSEWNKETLASSLKALSENGFNIGDIGFDMSELVGPDVDPWDDMKEDSGSADSEEPGNLERILLVYDANEYAVVSSMGENLMEKTGQANYSMLFKHLLEQATNADS